MRAQTHSEWIAWVVAMIVAFALASATAGCGGGDTDETDDDAVDDDDVDDDETDDDESDDDAADDDSADDDADDNPYFDPKEWGPYAVGNRRYIFVDESRSDLPSKGHRTLLTEIWYPAADAAADLPHDTVGDFLAPWKDLVVTVLRLLGATEDEEANVEQETGSVFDAPIRPTGGPFPVVLLSHGNQSLRFAHWTLEEYLASHGYVVVAPDHIGNAIFVTLPDRLAIYSALHKPFALDARVGDMGFLADTVEQINADDPDGTFTGRLDLESLGAVGHSFGGQTVFQWGSMDERARAVVNMALPVDPAEFASEAPLMLMAAGEDRTVGDWHPVLDDSDNPSGGVYMELVDAGHYTFSNACYLVPTLFGDGDGCGRGRRGGSGEEFDYIDPELGFQIMNSYITAFFGYHLKGQEEMLPDLTANRYPDEILFRVVPSEVGE